MTALITGASGGIGEELARIFAARKFDLVLVARGEAKLQTLAAVLSRAHGVKASVIAADLSEPAAPQTIFDAVQKQSATIDVLVNNAGFGARGPYAELDYDVEARMIQLNVATLAHLTRLFLPGMIARKSGKVLNVASTAAFVPGPFMAVYYASKAFVLSFSEALAEEVQGTGVSVTALCPGPTGTNFAVTAGNQDTPIFKSGKVMDARTVAQIGFDALMSGKRLAIAGLSNQISAFSARLAPRAMLAKIARKLNT